MDAGTATLLTVNVGSSSVKLDLFGVAPGNDIERVAAARFPGGVSPTSTVQAFLSEHAVDRSRVEAVAHRIVHGGNLLTAPTSLSERLDARLGELASLAPLHNPPAFLWLRACRDLFGPECVQVLVPDTEFFKDLPEVARSYALPASLVSRYELRRYGFHGLAHEAMWHYWQSTGSPGAKIITLQLGAGCSIAAIRQGAPIDTSMGFTPLEGLVMASRSGDVDPGLLTWLQKRASMTPDEVEAILNEHSGLLGVSGSSGDVSELLADDSHGARKAIEMYVYRARKYLGAYMSALGGVDGILFGGGTGEHVPEVRARILEDMAWCGVEFDAARNAHLTGGSGVISTAGGKVAIHVVRVDEATLLAKAVNGFRHAAQRM